MRTRAARGDQPPPEDELGVTAPMSGSWWSQFISEEDYVKIEHSGKLVLLMDILRQCELIGDKVLVFSQSLVSLNLIEAFLAAEDQQNEQNRQTASLASDVILFLFIYKSVWDLITYLTDKKWENRVYRYVAFEHGLLQIRRTNVTGIAQKLVQFFQQSKQSSFPSVSYINQSRWFGNQFSSCKSCHYFWRFLEPFTRRAEHLSRLSVWDFLSY